MLNPTARTAIARNKLSSPMAYLYKQGLIIGQSLDYGCGRGTDAKILNQTLVFPMHMYDPYWCLHVRRMNTYDTITCNYVLNVIQSEREREHVLRWIRCMLKPTGKAYISVRADVKQSGFTKSGSWQGDIFLNLPLLHRTKQYRMYVMSKDGSE